jgi:NAD(P)-dependent dehydrogenase (short-subunit alcohol dehydrogenase family)
LVLDLLVEEEGFYAAARYDAGARGGAGTSYAMRADVTQRAAWEAALAKSQELFGRPPSVVINNAGWTYSNKSTLDVTDDEFDRTFQINVKSIYLSVDVLIPAILATKAPASFVNVSSTGALRPRPRLVWCKFIFPHPVSPSLTMSYPAQITLPRAPSPPLQRVSPSSSLQTIFASTRSPPSLVTHPCTSQSSTPASASLLSH